MNPAHAIQEAEIICRLTEQYRADPAARIPGLREIRAESGLQQPSFNLEYFRNNLEQLQAFLRRTPNLEVSRIISAYHPKNIEKTIFGFRAECSEEILFEETLPISEFLRFCNCTLLFEPDMEGRTVLFWDYQDCSQPTGCVRATDPDFAEDVLYMRNFFLADVCYQAGAPKIDDPSEADPFGFVLNVLQNILAAGLAKNGMTRESLVRGGYMPMRDTLELFKQLLPECQLSSLDYVIEATLFAIHAASGILPQQILLTLIRTIPLNVLPDELPVIAEEYRRRHDERFHNYLEKTKRRMAEVDRLLADHGLFADLLRSSEPPKK